MGDQRLEIGGFGAPIGKCGVGLFASVNRAVASAGDCSKIAASRLESSTTIASAFAWFGGMESRSGATLSHIKSTGHPAALELHQIAALRLE